MRKHELEHIIRAAGDLTNEYEFVVIGSQSLLGSVSNPPQECVMSLEADIYPMGAEALGDLIEGAIGEGSAFHERFGYYAQAVDSSTAVLPTGWQQRLVRLQSRNTNGRTGFCLDPTDLFLAKCVANREKDRGFNRALLKAGIVQLEEALARLPQMPLPDEEHRRIAQRIRRLYREALDG